MRTKIILISLLSIVILSCKSESDKANYKSEVEVVSIVDTLSLKLIDDQKWIANAETHIGVTKMDSIISSFKNTNKTDYKTLGDNLSKQTSFIIKHCSMKGKPHDQLHVVLIPMLDEISILREETNQEKNKLALHNLELLIGAYFKFFKV